MSLLVFKSEVAGPIVLIIIIAVVVGILKKIFQGKKSLITGERKCQHCGRTLSKLDANFCRYCGTKLKTIVHKKKKTILGTIVKIIVVIFIILFLIGMITSINT